MCSHLRWLPAAAVAVYFQKASGGTVKMGLGERLQVICKFRGEAL
jgi:hypothetical protein